jgi:hypothetical protein
MRFVNTTQKQVKYVQEQATTRKCESIENQTFIKPLEEATSRTTLILRQSIRDGVSKYAFAQKMTLADVIDELLSIGLSKANDTTAIDQMDGQTNNFIFSRDIARVKKLLPPEIAKKFLPYQIAYLYTKTKDPSDAEKLFAALQLEDKIDEISEVNRVLETASKFGKEGQLLGYNFATLANMQKARLSLLQSEYLALKIGQEACNNIQARRPDLFPKPNVFSDDAETEEETS